MFPSALSTGTPLKMADWLETEANVTVYVERQVAEEETPHLRAFDPGDAVLKDIDFIICLGPSWGVRR